MFDRRLSMPSEATHPLVALRVARGLSQERVAQLAGVSARTIYGIERRGHAPQRSTAAAIAAVLGCAPNDLLNEAEPETATAQVTTTRAAAPTKEHSRCPDYLIAETNTRV